MMHLAFHTTSCGNLRVLTGHHNHNSLLHSVSLLILSCALQDIMFILHAEHEMNCSTAAARHLASSGVDVYTAIAGAVGALYGPLHGGANEAVLRMLERIGVRENVPSFLERVKSRKEKLFGFGHRVYKNFDPRAAVIRKV